MLNQGQSEGLVEHHSNCDHQSAIECGISGALCLDPPDYQTYSLLIVLLSSSEVIKSALENFIILRFFVLFFHSTKFKIKTIFCTFPNEELPHHNHQDPWWWRVVLTYCSLSWPNRLSYCKSYIWLYFWTCPWAEHPSVDVQGIWVHSGKGNQGLEYLISFTQRINIKTAFRAHTWLGDLSADAHRLQLSCSFVWARP